MMRKRRWSAPRWPARWRNSGSNAARTDSLNLFGEALRQALEGRGTVERIEPHVEQAKTGRVPRRGGQRVVEFLFGGDDKSAPGAEQFREPVVVPRQHVVIGAILHVALGAVAAVVEEDDDGIEAETHGGGQFQSGHLKGAVADQHQRPQFGGGQLRAQALRDGKPPPGIVSRTEKFGAMMNEEV